ncbi:MAG: NAD(P)-dependent oxidoreductase [Sulfolobales archaeon]
MKILVTGCGGYIGTTLTPYLLRKGYSVRCVDRLYFGEDLLSHVIGEKGFELVKADIRTVDPEVLNGVDAVIDMAALSNDPSGELNPEWTLSINYRGRVRIANIAAKKGAKRYILISSCSVYGKQDSVADEDSEPNPLTTYARAHIYAEREILPLASKSFETLVLRLATVYGLSKRMRFDLMVNGMTLWAYEKGVIRVMRDGTQIRPLIHIMDVSRAIYLALEVDRDRVNGKVINVGSDDQNYRVIDVAAIVRRIVGGEIEFYGDPDKRSYRVSFKRARELLGFEALYNVEDGVKQIYHELVLGNLRRDPRWITVEWYKKLLERNPGALEP